MRLLYDANVPGYDEGLRLYEQECANARQRRQQGEEESAEEEDERDDNDEEETFVCPSCNGTLEAEIFDVHKAKCPVRLSVS